jgi:hypothetical protein
MTPDTRAVSAPPAATEKERPRFDIAILHPNWDERMVTVVAATTALLVVALIAVLIGTA